MSGKGKPATGLDPVERDPVEAVLERYIDHKVRHGVAPDLAELCRESPELREPLGEYVRTYERLDRALVSPEGLKPGQNLLHYRIVEKLGEGGMGEVYAAEDRKLDRRVALKVLSPEMAGDREWLERFRREAKAVAALNHPSIVTLHSVEEADGFHFLTMELVEGTTLSRRIGESGMPLAELFDLAIPIADALAVAHEHGVVHRDLKPRNVMVNEDGQVKILDFGLAKLTGGHGGEDASQLSTETLTRSGRILGTLSYMSPEQIQGQPADARTDIFSLGVVLYRMATGCLPFQGENMPSLMSSVLRDTPPPVTELNREVPDRLARIVEHCLEKSPRRRWQSALDLASELRDLRQEIESGETPASSVKTAAARPPRRWPFLAAGAFLVAALLILAVVYLPGAWQQLGEGTASDPDTQSAAELTAFQLYERGQEALERFDKKGNLDLAIDSFQRILEKDESSAAAYAGLAKAFWLKFKTTKDGFWLTKTLPVARLAVKLNEHLAVAHVSLGLAASALGETQAALDEFETALTLDASAADAHLGIGKIHESESRIGEAIDSYTRAIELRSDRRMYYDDLGSLYYRHGRYKEAAELHLKSIELAPDGIYGYRNLAAVRYAQGRVTDAKRLLQQALEIEPQADLYTNLGFILFYEGLYRKAARAFDEAINSGGAHKYTHWGNLADAYRWSPGKEKEAKDAFTVAISLLQKDIEASSEDIELLTRLSVFLAKRGDVEDALVVMRKIDFSPETSATALARLVQAYEICGERTAALEALGVALRAGHPLKPYAEELELEDLRADPRYHLLLVDIDAISGNEPRG